jgi:hypothetical protein
VNRSWTLLLHQVAAGGVLGNLILTPLVALSLALAANMSVRCRPARLRCHRRLQRMLRSAYAETWAAWQGRTVET